MPTLANNKRRFFEQRKERAATCGRNVCATILESETEPGLVAIMRRLQYAPRYVPLRAIVLHSRK